jgi:glycosyltransferase involved in cell wall biosynthesis
MRHDGFPQTEYDVSIVVCTKDRAPLLDQMLVSLSDAIQNTSCEVIVVDGGSSDNTLEVLRRHGVTKIYNEAECLGPGRHSWPQLYNLGFSKARGKWAMYASDDIIFGEGCITEAVKSLNQQTDEVAGGIFFYKNLHEKSSVEKFYTGRYFIGFSCGQKLIMNYGLFRMDYFREVGGLDERYRFYCADGDLCLKLYESGKQLVPLPQCFLIHNNVLDMQKKSSEEGLKDDDSLYRQRWRHFVSTDDPNPRRLLWQPDFVEAFALPAALRPVDSGIEYFWHGIACLQRGMFKMALEKFAQTMRTSCRHWVVLWYSAKAAYGCGNFEVAKKAAQMVVKHVPEFNQAQQFLAGLDAVSSTLQIKNTSADLPKFGLGAEVESKPRKIYCVLFDTMPLLDEVVSLAKENAIELLRQVGGCFTTTSCIEMLTGKLCSDLEKNGMGYERHNRYRDPVTNDIHWPWEKELIVNRLLEHGWQVSLHNSVYFSTVLSSNPAFEKTTSLPGGLQAEKEFWNDKKAIVETILGDGPQSEQFYQDEIRHIHQIQSEKPAKDKFYFVKYDQFHVANVEKSDKNAAARRVIELMKQWDFNEPNAMFWFFSDHGDWRMMGEHPQPDHYLAWVMFRDNTADAVEVKSRFIFAGDFFPTIMNKFGYGYESIPEARSVRKPQDTDRIYYTEDGRQRFDVNDSTTAIACRFTGWDRGRPSGLVQVSYFKPRNEFVCLLAHLNADGFVTNTVRIDKIDECLKQALIDRFEWVDGELTLVKGSVGQQLCSPQERFLVSQTGLDTSTRRIDNVSHMEDIRNVAGQVQAIESKTNTLSQLEAAGLWRQGQPLRLHLGCGNQRLDGYINIDYPPDKHTVVAQLGADFYADITKLSFPAQSVEEVRLHHVLEHFNRGVALGLLVQWHRWLKIGAKLHIETPDALGCARMLASSISYKIKQGILRHMFGSHEADWAYHYDGWYDEKFQKTLSSLGFEVTCHTSKWQHEPYLANVKAVAIKCRNLSREQLLVVCDRLLLDSMVADVPAERRMHEIWCQEIRNFQNDGVPVQAAQEQHHLPSSGKQCSMMFTAGKDLSDFNSSCSEKALS